MPDRENSTNAAPRAARVLRRAALGAASATMVAGMLGCETDAWFMDPSVVGYWEHTPTRVPILDRISAIEGPEDTFVEIDQIEPADLIPVVESYRAGPGDLIELQIWDIPIVGQPSLFQAIVDSRGFIEVPELGKIYVNAMTSDEIRDAVIDSARDLVAEPVATIVISSRRDATYSIIGQVGGPGTYIVPEPDFRLLEALTTAGGIPESLPNVYIIRQVALADSIRGVGETPVEQVPGEQNDRPPPSPEDLIDIIDDLSNPDDDGGAPVVFASGSDSRIARAQPAEDQPPIDLITPDEDETPAQPIPGETGTWMFLNGKWVRVRAPGAQDDRGLPTPGTPAQAADQLVTQRVIEIPVRRLLAGDARYNPVVRPGDVIRVPAPLQGPIYITGDVNRPGTYSLPGIGKITLAQAIAASGGLSAIAMPERVDLTRRVGPNHQATIRLNLRAIFEHTQPDIFLKPEDTINVGTSFWAFPWAVARNGFRVTYGFGFLLDRNFGNDVFGAPPTNIGGGF